MCDLLPGIPSGGHHDALFPQSPFVHWAIAACVLALVPVGLWMVARCEANLWDNLTNTLHGIHKATGFPVLLLISLTP